MRSLTADRVHILRTAGKPDSYFARIWRMTTGAIRDARVGRTWPNHTTPADTAPRGPGRPFKRIRPATNIDAALSAWRADNGRGNHGQG